MEDALEDTKKELAGKGVTRLKQTSPKSAGKKRSGTYARSWAKKKVGKKIVIHNKEYQLTHLLEKGHAKTGGGRVEARVHIEPVEKELQKSAIGIFRGKLK